MDDLDVTKIVQDVLADMQLEHARAIRREGAANSRLQEDVTESVKLKREQPVVAETAHVSASEAEKRVLEENKRVTLQRDILRREIVAMQGAARGSRDNNTVVKQ